MHRASPFPCGWLGHLHRLARVAVPAAALLAAFPVAAQGSAPTPPSSSLTSVRQVLTSIGEMLRDEDQDRVPDAVGDTVLVAGRATVGTGQLHRRWSEVFIQDETGGIKLLASSGTQRIASADSVVVQGVLSHELGMAQLVDPVFRVVPAAPRPLTPLVVPSSLGPLVLEPYEGRVVELRGHVVAQQVVEAGQLLILLVDKELIQVFAYADRAEPITFEEFEVGDYVQASGVAGQFDRAAPFTGSYQLFPRKPGDVIRAGLPPSFYRMAALGVALLLALAVGWAWALRIQVRKRAAQLHASEARYEHLFNTAGDAVLVHADRTNGWILEANRVALDALGYGAEALQRSTLRALAALGAAETLDQHLRSVRERGEALGVIPLRTAGGQVTPFEIRTQRVTFDGESVFVSLARDVTARQAYEQGLIAARREAEEMARLKSALLANMSHEIRTPLTAIIGFAEVLSEEVGPEQREFAQMIEHGGKRLLDTLNSVLDLARLDAGQERLQPEPLDVVGELRSLAALFEPMARKSGLTLQLDLDAPALPVLHDPGALGRILHNLVGNAVKFTERGGVLLSLRTGPTALAIYVTDTGIGIDEAFLPSLFTEFKQESEGFARSHEGTGLGLAITKRLVDLMGGTIAVESRKGVGTRFTVTLPRTQPVDRPSSGDGAATAVAPVFPHAVSPAA